MERVGHSIKNSETQLTSLFPTATELVQVDLSGLGIAKRDVVVLQEFARAVMQGKLDFGASTECVIASLSKLQGVGQSTAEYIALRALGEPDAFPVSDPVLREVDGLQKFSVSQLQARAEGWRPWRGYAAFQLLSAAAWNFFDRTLWGNAQQVLMNFVTHPQLELIHLVRWCLFVTGGSDAGGFNPMRWSFIFNWREFFIRYQKAHKKSIDLRELAAVYRTLNLDDRLIGQQVLQANRFAFSPFSHSHPETIWPYFAERLELLEGALGLSPSTEQSAYPNYLYGDLRENAFALLKLFPHAIARLLQPLVAPVRRLRLRCVRHHRYGNSGGDWCAQPQARYAECIVDGR